MEDQSIVKPTNNHYNIIVYHIYLVMVEVSYIRI